MKEEDARRLLQENRVNESSKQEQLIRYAAMHLRSIIMQIPKSKTPHPTTMNNLKECAPKIPSQLKLFFRYLLNGTVSPCTKSETNERKVITMASDAIYNLTRGSVKPWKLVTMGLGMTFLTGSKLALQILNRAGHCISYDDAKGYGTEFAYSIDASELDTTHGIKLNHQLATACVWDNHDVNVETLDGKDTLYATVGLTYQNELEEETPAENARSFALRDGRNRRSFKGCERAILPFKRPLGQARFLRKTAVDFSIQESDFTNSTATSSTAVNHQPCSSNVNLKLLDFFWFWLSQRKEIPLHAGFISLYMEDFLPIHRVACMDTICRSPTDNAVVRETMIRSMNVAEETGQEFSIVTYDLAVAQKAYAIQALEAPRFDNLLGLLGNFHIELAFYGAIGTFINESGIEYILHEAGILAEGSVVGFLKGKFYNRCTRIQGLLTNVLERKLYNLFLSQILSDELEKLNDTMESLSCDSNETEDDLSNEIIVLHLQKYEDFFSSVLSSAHGPTAQFWTTYIYFINRLHREVLRCVNVDDVDGYIEIFPKMLETFFSLNRSNYARWECYFWKN